MQGKKHWLVVLVVGVFLVGCGSPPTPAPSQTPEPTSTQVPTATPTETPPPTATATSTPTPEPTPDTRVIDVNPRKLSTIDGVLPEDGSFYLTDETPHRNSEILSSWGVEEGRQYLEESGRVDGWTTRYTRGTRTVFAPEFVQANAVIYESLDGPRASASLRENDEPCTDQEAALQGWGLTVLEEGFVGGTSSSYLCLFRQMQSSGKNYHVFYADIDIRNVGLQVWAGGLEDEFSQAWVMSFLEAYVDYVRSFPLSGEVTWSP